MKIVVLSLKHRTDRREHISKALEDEGLDYVFYDAIYWKDPNFDNILKMNEMKVCENWKVEKPEDLEGRTTPTDIVPYFGRGKGSQMDWYGREVNMGEVAVSASYYFLLKDLDTFNDSVDGPTLVLQDDASWESGYLKKYIEVVNNQEMEDIDIIYLCGVPCKKGNSGDETQGISIEHTDFEYPPYIYDATAIVFNPSGIKKILDSGIKKNLMSFDEYLMILYGDSWRMDMVDKVNKKHKLTCIKLKNAQKKLGQKGFKSDIDGSKEWKYMT